MFGDLLNFNPSGFIKYLKNTFWLLIEQVLRIISAIFIGIWVARFLGPEQFGLLSYVLAFTAIFRAVARLGLESPFCVKELSNARDYAIVMGTLFWLRQIGYALIFLLVFTILQITENDFHTKLYILIITGGFLFLNFDVIQFYFESKVQGKLISLCKISELLLIVCLKIYLILINAELIYFIIVYVIESALIALFFIFAYLKNYNKIFLFHFDLELAKSFIKNSWPLIISSISAFLLMHIDKVMVKQMLSDYSAGIYAAGIKFPQAIGFLPMVLAASLFPAILNSKKASYYAYQERLQKFYFLMTWMGIFLFLLFFFSANFLVSFYGAEYYTARDILIIYSFSVIFLFQWIARGRWIIAENLQAITFYFMICGAVINIILNYFLILHLGISGAAISTVISQILITLVIPLFFKKIRGSTVMLFKSFFHGE